MIAMKLEFRLQENDADGFSEEVREDRCLESCTDAVGGKVVLHCNGCFRRGAHGGDKSKRFSGGGMWEGGVNTRFVH